MVFSYKFDQNTHIGSGGRVQTMLILQSLKYSNLKNYVKVNQNLTKSFTYSNNTMHKV